ncbi:MAG: hypothetical protein IAF02_13625 [Anaerolineae bacterium]|nr:hypothetical protein [Anaerolineae bacterium]
MEKKSFDIRIIVVLGLAMTLFMLALTFGQNTSADDLPPRDTSVPTVTPESQPEPTTDASSLPEGGTIEMKAAFSSEWPWDQMMWQDLWLEVEWTDGKEWFKVDGWKGNLDSIDQEDGVWVGYKAWWVAEHDLGSGPFRWLVYDQEGGNLLVTSEEFTLPAERGQSTVVDVALNP